MSSDHERTGLPRPPLTPELKRVDSLTGDEGRRGLRVTNITKGSDTVVDTSWLAGDGEGQRDGSGGEERHAAARLAARVSTTQ